MKNLFLALTLTFSANSFAAHLCEGSYLITTEDENCLPELDVSEVGISGLGKMLVLNHDLPGLVLSQDEVLGLSLSAIGVDFEYDVQIDELDFSIEGEISPKKASKSMVMFVEGKKKVVSSEVSCSEKSLILKAHMNRQGGKSVSMTCEYKRINEE